MNTVHTTRFNLRADAWCIMILQLNADVPGALASVASEIGATIVYVSTGGSLSGFFADVSS